MFFPERSEGKGGWRGGLGGVGGRRGVLVEGECGGGERELGFGGKEWIWRGESKHSKPKVCLIQN